MKSKKITVGNHTVDLRTKDDVVPVRGKQFNELQDDFDAHIPSDGTGNFDTITEKTANAGVTVESVVIKDGGITANLIKTNYVIYQGTPVNSNTDPADKPALASAMYSSHILTATPAAPINYTLPTGTQMQTALGSLVDVDQAFDITIINIGAGGIITVVAAADFTIVGTATIAVNTSARFRVRKTAANTFVLYRL